MAGRIFRRYREDGGPREYLIPDFLIAAHAFAQAGQLAAIDRGYVRPTSQSLRSSPLRHKSSALSLVMLATTPEADACAFAEFTRMLADAGFQRQQPTTFRLAGVVTVALEQWRRRMGRTLRSYKATPRLSSVRALS